MRDKSTPTHLGLASLVSLGIGLALVTLVVQWPLVFRMVVPMDEGHLAAAVSWMLDGKHLYRDIHTGIFPGVYLLTYGLFGVFGEDLVLTRQAAAIVNVVTALLLWRITARCTDERWGWLAPLGYVAFLPLAFPVTSLLNYSTLAVAYGLAALYFLLRTLEHRRVADAAAMGLFIAFAALTKQNFGALVFIACAVGGLLGGRGEGFDRRDWQRLIPTIAVAGLVPTLAVVIGFLATGTFMDLVESTILSLGGSQVQNFNNPIPPIFGAHPENDGRFTFLYTPPPMFDDLLEGGTTLGVKPTPFVRSLAIRLSYGLPMAMLLAGAFIAWRDRAAPDDEAARSTRPVLLYAIIFFPGIFPSAIFSHLAFVLIPLFPVYVIVAHRLHAAVSGRLGGAPAAAWRAFVVPALAAMVGLVWAAAGAEARTKAIARNDVPLDMPRAEMFVSERMAGLLGGAVGFIDRCAAPGEDVFVAPDIPVVYFLTDRRTPQPHDLVIPGNVDGRMIAHRLEASDVRCVVFNPRMYPEFPPFATIFPDLAAYMQNRFVRVETFTGGGSEWYGLQRRAGGARR